MIVAHKNSCKLKDFKRNIKFFRMLNRNSSIQYMYLLIFILNMKNIKNKIDIKIFNGFSL